MLQSAELLNHSLPQERVNGGVCQHQVALLVRELLLLGLAPRLGGLVSRVAQHISEGHAVGRQNGSGHDGTEGLAQFVRIAQVPHQRVAPDIHLRLGRHDGQLINWATFSKGQLVDDVAGRSRQGCRGLM